MVATEASVGVTGIMAVLMEFKMADKKRYFFSCFLISATVKGKAVDLFYKDDEDIFKVRKKNSAFFFFNLISNY